MAELSNRAPEVNPHAGDDYPYFIPTNETKRLYRGEHGGRISLQTQALWTGWTVWPEHPDLRGHQPYSARRGGKAPAQLGRRLQRWGSDPCCYWFRLGQNRRARHRG